MLEFINSIEQAAAYLQLPDEAGEERKKEIGWLTVQIGKYNKTFKVPHFLTQAFDYPVSLLGELLIFLYFCVYNMSAQFIL